ncbi:PDZ domain-containing protein [Chitinophaga varians]|uniref:PDZ domain-containing protein n=1 Tax=Chitinophaga varians TaxID=2202339 RepID=UPI00165FF3CA|nr:PDZ domain-containing protein [Chitinophaga varians]MBC9911271.1 PDZ domain-containing protein [Chitinophaga varians]
MKNVLRNFTLAGFSCLAVSVAAAQSPGASAKDKMGEYDEIVIKNKSNKGGKVIVEIKDGDILLDGQKMDQYSNPDISVFRRRITPMNGNNFSFDNGSSRDEIQLFGSEGDDEGEELPITGNKAVLGVITEKTTAVGATVKSVAPGSPADKAGIKVGDAITKINNEVINEPKALFETIGRFKPGDKITVSYTRNNKQNKATVTLDERKENSFGGIFNAPRRRSELFTFPMPRGGQGFGFERADEGVKLGIQVQDTDDGNGAQVINMAPGSPAEKAGFKVNDLITDMAGSTVKSAHDVAEIYRANRDKGTITATIKRNGQTQTIDIKVPKKLHTADL